MEQPVHRESMPRWFAAMKVSIICVSCQILNEKSVAINLVKLSVTVELEILFMYLHFNLSEKKCIIISASSGT